MSISNADQQMLVTAGIAARDLFAMICEGEQHPHFWQTLAGLVATKLPTINPPELEGAMDEDEAVKFERQKMPRGSHEGDEVGDVSCSYLIYWAEGDKFSYNLRRYVASKTFARRQQEEEPDA